MDQVTNEQETPSQAKQEAKTNIKDVTDLYKFAHAHPHRGINTQTHTASTHRHPLMGFIMFCLGNFFPYRSCAYTLFCFYRILVL